MPDQPLVHVCPYLGLPNDRASHYGEPADAHRCYSPSKPGDIELDYQSSYCLSNKFPTCRRFATLPQVEATPAAPSNASPKVETKASPGIEVALAEADVEEAPPRFGANPLEIALWGLAIVLGILAVYSAWPVFFPQGQTSAVALATNTFVPRATLTPVPASTDTATATSTGTPLPTLAPLVIPTPPNDGEVLTLSPDANGTGWIGSKELAPHWGDRNLYAGWYQGQAYQSVLQFNLGNSLPPGSKILFAALELTGGNAAHLGKTGQWTLELIGGDQTKDWAQASTDEVANTPSLAVVSLPLSASDLAVGNTNRFGFGADQTQLFEKQLSLGRLTFRLKGPSQGDDNLFSWDAGSGAGSALSAPTLYIVAVPAAFTVVANTPTPANVFTAAAYSVKETAFARQFGTPTPFGPGVVTATPGGEPILVPATPQAGNAATAEALSAYATAVALTTGTITSTPPNMIILYPTWTPTATATPVFYDVSQLTPPATPTTSVNYLATPMPSFLLGKILIVSDRFGSAYANRPVVMNPDGSVFGTLSAAGYYQAAAARESYSPDRQRQANYQTDGRGLQQIAIKDLQTGGLTQVTNISRGTDYDVAWSPDGTALAYVSTETGGDEIYVYDLGTKLSRRLTNSGPLLPWNKRPSWSPDSQKIVFWSSQSGHAQIMVINRDGTGLMNLSNNSYDEKDPIWVKP